MKERTKAFFNHKYTITLLFNLGVLAVLLLIACPRYASDIDILMQSILSGLGSAGPDSHIIYSSILLGKTLKVLGFVASGMAWYTVMQYAFVFGSLCTMTYAFLHRPHNLAKRLIVLFFLCFVGYECYITPSYAKTAIALGVAACVLLVDTMRGCVRPRVRYVWTALLLWAAFLVSFRIALAAVAVCAGGILILYLRKKELRFTRFGLLALAAAVLLVTASEGVEYSRYSANETYRAEKENAQAIEKLYLFGAAGYTAQIGEQTGLSQSEYEAIVAGRFVSEDADVTAYFPVVAGLHWHLGRSVVRRFFRTVPIRMFRIPLFFGCAVVLALVYLSNRERRRVIVMAVILWLVMYALLFFGNAWTGAAVPLLVFLPIGALAMGEYGQIANAHIREMTVFACLLAVLMYMNFSSGLVTSVRTESMQSAYTSVCTSDETYVVDVISFLQEFSVFRAYPQGMLDVGSVSVVNGIYRDVYGFETNIFYNETLVEEPTQWYGGTAEEISVTP